MRFKHPCPNCAALRSGPRTSCDQCGYPHHTRSGNPFPPPNFKPFQFNLASLVSSLSIAAVMLAIFSSIDFEVAVIIAGVLYPILNFLDQFRENLWEQAKIDRRRMEAQAGPFSNGELTPPSEDDHQASA
jgi:hypothetical protein